MLPLILGSRRFTSPGVRGGTTLARLFATSSRACDGWGDGGGSRSYDNNGNGTWSSTGGGGSAGSWQRGDAVQGQGASYYGDEVGDWYEARETEEVPELDRSEPDARHLGKSSAPSSRRSTLEDELPAWRAQSLLTHASSKKRGGLFGTVVLNDDGTWTKEKLAYSRWKAALPFYGQSKLTDLQEETLERLNAKDCLRALVAGAGKTEDEARAKGYQFRQQLREHIEGLSVEERVPFFRIWIFPFSRRFRTIRWPTTWATNDRGQSAQRDGLNAESDGTASEKDEKEAAEGEAVAKPRRGVVGRPPNAKRTIESVAQVPWSEDEEVAFGETVEKVLRTAYENAPTNTALPSILRQPSVLSFGGPEIFGSNPRKRVSRSGYIMGATRFWQLVRGELKARGLPGRSNQVLTQKLRQAGTFGQEMTRWQELGAHFDAVTLPLSTVKVADKESLARTDPGIAAAIAPTAGHNRDELEAYRGGNEERDDWWKKEEGEPRYKY